MRHLARYAILQTGCRKNYQSKCVRQCQSAFCNKSIFRGNPIRVELTMFFESDNRPGHRRQPRALITSKFP